MNRRGAFSVIVLSLFSISAFAQSDIADGKLIYRGFTVDVSVVQNAPNFAAIENSLKHQIDIAADCGAKSEILSFFRSQEIVLKPGAGDGGGSFSANTKGVKVDAAVEPPEKPVILHELLHAYHFRVLPGRFHNADILRFYNNAKQGRRYQATAYVLKNPQEFFAVTASLYLWGNVDRPPFTRQRLKAQQPVYYAWLGQQFGVQK